jgi:RNA polymerase subunit RPABC4/transcription elongation factor Spt4/high-affinity Fe2+/Pb2+ permease
MPDFIRGAKAGVISGVIFGIVVAIFLNSSYYRYFNISSFLMSIVAASIYLSIICMLFGLLFVRVYSKIPGDNALSKSIILCIFLWASIFLLVAMFTLTNSSRYVLNIYQGLIYFLIGFVIFGITYALIFERIKPTFVPSNISQITCINCGRVIKNDYNQCPYCEINLKKCIRCGKIIKEDYKQCPYCGLTL